MLGGDTPLPRLPFELPPHCSAACNASLRDACPSPRPHPLPSSAPRSRVRPHRWSDSVLQGDPQPRCVERAASVRGSSASAPSDPADRTVRGVSSSLVFWGTPRPWLSSCLPGCFLLSSRNPPPPRLTPKYSWVARHRLGRLRLLWGPRSVPWP